MKVNNVAIGEVVEMVTNEEIHELTNANGNKWMLADDYIFSIGECYRFTSDIDVEHYEDDIKTPQLWGIFSKLELEGVILEVATTDLTSFHYNYTIPANYSYVKIMSRDEIRDFAYNMGYSDGLMVDDAEIFENANIKEAN